MLTTSRDMKRQLPKNSIFQAIAFSTRVIVGIWLVPYLISHLGTAAYGLLPIAALMTQYASLISGSIATAVNRYLSIALQRDDRDDANRVYSTAFYSFLAIGALQVPLFGAAIGFVDHIVAVPEGLMLDAQALLGCSAAAFLLNLVSSIYAAPAYAFNRLDVSRSLDIVRVVFRLVGIVALFGLLGPSLRLVGYVDLITAVVCLVGQIVTARRIAPYLRVHLRDFDLSKVGQVTGLGGWLLVNQLGSLLFLQMDVWICNRFISPEAAGQYAALLLWPSLLRQGGSTIATVVAPIIMIYFARGEMNQLVRVSTASVRILSLVLAVGISTLCVFSTPLLRLWLGDSFVQFSPLMVLLLGHLAINVGVTPLFNVQVAIDRVRLPALVTLTGGVINIALAIMLAQQESWGIYGVAAAGAIVLTAKNAVFTPLYASYTLKLPWHTFVTPYLSALLCSALVCAVGLGIHQAASDSPGAMVASMAATLAIGGATTWFLLPGCDRSQLRAMIGSGGRKLPAEVAKTAARQQDS